MKHDVNQQKMGSFAERIASEKRPEAKRRDQAIAETTADREHKISHIVGCFLHAAGTTIASGAQVNVTLGAELAGMYAAMPRGTEVTVALDFLPASACSITQRTLYQSLLIGGFIGRHGPQARDHLPQCRGNFESSLHLTFKNEEDFGLFFNSLHRDNALSLPVPGRLGRW